jgi:uncharacterized integral membrane protein
MRIIYLILVIILALFGVTFSQFNSTPIRLKYFNFFDIEIQPYMLIFISLLAGVIITGFWGIVERFRLNRTISRLNKTIRDLRKELRANQPTTIIDKETMS